MNCIESDNEIHLVPDRLFILEEKVLRLEEQIFLLSNILEKYHPKFDEDGIL